uniref:Ribosomal RNA-processing protein 43 n=1 Tax=Aceria tosichella TaxID=561515 RepID=A0A6G1SD32_9ACAR
MAEEFRVLRPYEFHCQLIKKGQRADGRKLDEFRDIKLEVDAISTADSSSLVKLGNTSLVCGCITRLSKKTDNSNESDDINIHVELPPICSSPTGHRTQHTAQLLTKTLKNVLDDMKCLDRNCLSVDNENLSWSIDVEVICLNYDGCLLDAALIAVLAALKSLKLTDETSGISQKFILNKMPIRSSFAIIGDRVICDPNLEEETVAQSTMSITIEPSSHGDNCHINKQGGKAIDFQKLSECTRLAKQRATLILKQLSECPALCHGDAMMDCL